MGKMKGGGMNAKAAAALEKKAAHQSKQAEKTAAQKEKELQQEWSSGANNRAADREAQAAMKADEAARKRREKAELLAQEEAGLAGVSGKAAKKVPVLSAKKKGKKKDDLSMLEDAIVSAADKKQKAKIKAEREKKEKQAMEAKLRAQKEEEEKAKLDPLLANTEIMISGTEEELVGRAANKALDDDEIGASGIDGALQNLNLGGGPAPGRPNLKALYKAFEEKMMPVVKEEYPRLKLSQYKEKIYNAWKKSPENPMNQVPK